MQGNWQSTAGKPFQLLGYRMHGRTFASMQLLQGRKLRTFSGYFHRTSAVYNQRQRLCTVPRMPCNVVVTGGLRCM